MSYVIFINVFLGTFLLDMSDRNRWVYEVWFSCWKLHFHSGASPLMEYAHLLSEESKQFQRETNNWKKTKNWDQSTFVLHIWGQFIRPLRLHRCGQKVPFLTAVIVPLSFCNLSHVHTWKTNLSDNWADVLLYYGYLLTLVLCLSAACPFSDSFNSHSCFADRDV